MTWYAGYILTSPEKTIIDDLSTIPNIDKNLYKIRDLNNFKWFDKKVKHDLSDEGLLVCREVFNKESTDEAEYYNDEFISTDKFVGPENYEVLKPQMVKDILKDEIDVDHFEEVCPPINFLRFLKWLNRNNKKVISYYYCATWGGDTEMEFSWTFEDSEEIIFLYKDDVNTLKLNKSKEKTIINDAVLKLTLLQHKITLPSNYFALCSRSFDWNQYRL